MLRINLASSLGSHDRKRRRTLITRFVLMSFVAFFIAQVVPTLAEESKTVEEIISEETPRSIESLPETPTTSSSPTPDAQPEGTKTPTPTPIPSATFTPPKALESQGMKIQMSSKVSVDPRAQIVRMPAISVTGPEYLLLCIQSQSSVFDLLTKGVPNNVVATNLYVGGDLTSTVTLAGPTSLVISVFNSEGGAKVSSLGGFLSNKIVEVNFVATDGLAVDSSMCAKVAPGNKRVILLSPLSLGLELKKGEVRLEK
jgi:hypothetical protein